MGRLVFESGRQRDFLEKVMRQLGISSGGLSGLIGISQKSVQRWLNETTLGEEVAMRRLSRLTDVALPLILETREEHWGNRLSHKPPLQRVIFKRNPGNLEGRRKGGRVSQERRHLNPGYYKKLGCNIGFQFKLPDKPNVKLAEFIGILLGDGSIRQDQVDITLNAVVDADYAFYVFDLIEKLFDYQPYVYKRKKEKAVRIILTGVSLVNELVGLGMKRGDKIRQQVGVPACLMSDLELKRWCLRGLMDTDGGVFTHRYQVGGKNYTYLKLNFTNKSQPLLRFVYETLTEVGFVPKYWGVNKVWLYSDGETRRYLDVVGSSNRRLLRKIE